MVTVFGSINIDIVGHAPTLMRPGETVLGTTLEIVPGGKGANQALAAARAGASVALVGCVGQDDFANAALAQLEGAGVDLSGVQRVKGMTGTALIVVDDAGENMITVLPGANQSLKSQALADKGVDAGELVLFQLETPLEDVAEAARFARNNGAVTVLNMAPFSAVPESLLADISYLIVNEIELAGLLDMLDAPKMDVDQAIEWLATRFGNTVIATLGAKGARAFWQNAIITAPALEITPVDTVGAGDTFVGYFAAGLASGLSFEAALNRASVAAGLACLNPGAQTAMPDRASVDVRMGTFAKL